MILSKRLENIAALVDNCSKIADIGTDHGYIPIFLVENKICYSAIASDINKSPVEKALLNIKRHKLLDKIECRLGGGLTVLNPLEVQGAVIAGMGGNLIRDIIEDSMEIFKTMNFCVLQPVQNPEILREYIYKRGFTILDEDLCYEDQKYYEIIKVVYGSKASNIDSIYYEIGEKLIEKKHPLLKNFIKYKINQYSKVIEYIKDNTANATMKKNEVKNKILQLEELLKQCI